MPVEPSIAFSVSWIARMLRTRFDARARALGLTRAQWTMMLSVKMREGATQSDLASRLEINSVTAGRIIDRLEAAGWIERRPDPVDRRANRLYLAGGATPMLDQLSQLGSEEESVMLRGLGEPARARLAETLAQIVDNLTTAPSVIALQRGDEASASIQPPPA